MFATHGTLQDITFKGVESSGIKTGTTYTMTNGKEMVGIDDVAKLAWGPNTKLITYVSCNSGGEYGIWSNQSITHYSVAIGGANVAVGFNKIIYLDSAEQWSRNYNMWLASGYGISDAVDYANSINYDNNNVHSTLLVYDGIVDPNMKIGKYATDTTAFIEDDSIESSYLINNYRSRNLIDTNIDIKEIKNLKNSIVSLISNYDEDFVDGDYEIFENETCIINALNGDEEKTKYITAVLKIGDFYTDSAYVLKVKDSNIEAIYDNTLEKELVESAINSNNLRTTSINNTEEIINVCKNSYVESSDENISIKENDVKYYYDIINNKKYIEVPIESTINNSSKMVNYIKYEI